jgi:ectoine hydroxylase-related dioxygenase (phytanoyl-CoA dioxygenase family)
MTMIQSEENIHSLPALDEHYSLSEQQIEAFRLNGHTVLRGVAAPEEIAVYEPLINHWVKKLNYHDKPVAERDTYGKAFIQVSNLWVESEAIRRFALAKRFAKIAADLLGVDGIRIYHDQALFKEPGGGHTPWHQDQIYWPLDGVDTVTMWMPLVPVSEEIGSMTFASDSHKQGYISKAVISDESHRTLSEHIEKKGYETLSYGAMDAGDATFHAGWTLHSAPGNPTETMREVMTVIYYPDGARISEPDSKARINDLKNWFPGLAPGDLAASPLNPLVYKR